MLDMLRIFINVIHFRNTVYFDILKLLQQNTKQKSFLISSQPFVISLKNKKIKQKGFSDIFKANLATQTTFVRSFVLEYFFSHF